MINHNRPSTATTAEPAAVPADHHLLSSLTPTQELIIEVLTARHRLGEPFWPFTTKLGKSIETLCAFDLVNERSGPVERTVYLSFTPKALRLLELQPVGSKASNTEPVKGEHIPPVNRAYADRIAAYLERIGSEKMAHRAVSRLFGSGR
jgi:hypothetical protein